MLADEVLINLGIAAPRRAARRASRLPRSIRMRANATL